MDRRTVFRRWRILECAAWFSGGVLVVAYLGSQLWLHADRERGVHEFERMRSVAALQSPSSSDDNTGGPRRSMARPLTAGVPETSSWSEARRIAYENAAAAGAAPTALLRIPSIELEAPVYAELSELNLNRGAAFVAGAGEGNAAIAAHRDGYFRALQDVRRGDVIELETLQGVSRYHITELRIVEPHQTEVLDGAEQPVLTLVTCYPFYFVGPAPRRFIVRAERIDAPALRRTAQAHEGPKFSGGGDDAR